MIFRVLIPFLLLTLAAVSAAQAAPQTLARIAAVVDTDIILEQQLLDELERVKSRIEAAGQTPPPNEILKRQVLEHLIVKEVQLQAADRVGINLDDTFLNEQLQKIAGESGMTLEQFKDKVESEGMDYVQYRNLLRDEMRVQQLRQRTVYDRVVVSEQEVEDYLAQNPIGSASVEYQLGHLLVGTPEAASPEEVEAARQKAEDLRQQLKEGASFPQLALSHSDGQRALDGGDLGWLPKGRVPTLFLEAIESLQKGQVSAPLQSPSGFHLVQLKGVRGDKRRVIDQVHTRHILLKPNAVMTDDQARQKITQLRRRIAESDESFSELAKAHSMDGSAAQGGDLGWAAPREYVPAFRQVVETLPLNTLSEPFRSDFGWHIVEVLEHRQYDETDEYRRGMARQELRKMKASEEEELWLRRLRDQTYVEYRLGLGEDPEIDAAQAATP